MKGGIGDWLKASPLVIGIVIILFSTGYALQYHNSQTAGFAFGYLLVWVGTLIELSDNIGIALIIASIVTIVMWGIISFLVF